MKRFIKWLYFKVWGKNIHIGNLDYEEPEQLEYPENCIICINVITINGTYYKIVDRVGSQEIFDRKIYAL